MTSPGPPRSGPDFDTFAREAADELLALPSHDALVIGHGDWHDGNARFDAGQRRGASAAGRWVLAFNARCELSNLGNRAHIDDDEIPETSPLGQLLRSGDAYQSLW